ncbi:8790_t:CDS:2 [Rhizophagus irregularis]|nr:8790_t:CDS:2 [Rhizophagus irregularis]
MGCVTSYLGSSSSERLSPTSEIHTKSLTSLPTTTIPTNVSTSDIASNTKARFGTCVNCSSPYISYNWCRNCAFPGKEKWTTDIRTFIFTKCSNINNSLTWNDKINILKSIAEIIKSLHNEKTPQGGKLFHGNLHPDMNQLYLKYSEQTMKVVEHQEHSTTKTKLSKITKNVIKNTSFINTGGLRDVMRKKFKKDDFHKNIHSEAYYTSRIFDFSLNRLSVSSNSNNSFMAGTSDDFETGQSSLAISEMGLDDVIEISAIDYTLSKDSKGKKKA